MALRIAGVGRVTVSLRRSTRPAMGRSLALVGPDSGSGRLADRRTFVLVLARLLALLVDGRPSRLGILLLGCLVAIGRLLLFGRRCRRTELGTQLGLEAVQHRHL